MTMIAAISTKIEIYPINVKINPSDSGLTKESVVKPNQIRTIDKGRLIKKLGKLSPSTMDAVNSAILLSLGIVP
jgi:mRNA interferase MazF